MTPPAPLERLAQRARGVVADARTAATVDVRGTVDFACLGAPDALPALYSLLDDAGASVGLRIDGRTPAPLAQRYVRTGVPVLVTELQAGEDVLEVRDHVRDGVIVRVCTARRGRPLVAAAITAASVDGPVRRVERWSEGASFGAVRGRPGVFVEGACVGAPVELQPGEHTVLTIAAHGGARLALAAALDAERRVGETWSALLDETQHAGPYEAAVRTSLMALRMCTIATTGGVLRARTTSLPVALGAERNFDERCAWLADAAEAVRLLHVVGQLDWADDVRGFLAEAARRDLPLPAALRWTGEPLGAVQELALRGWEGSWPVRVSHHDGAANDLTAIAAAMLVLDTARHWEQIGRLADWLAAHWDAADHGHWGGRAKPQRRTASVLAVRIALDAVVASARARDPLDTAVFPWIDAASACDAWLTTNGRFGRPPQAGWARTAADPSSDASLLRWAASTFPWVVPALVADEPGDAVARLRATVDQTRAQLGEERFLHRHGAHVDDGFAPGQGPDLAASFAYVTALARAQRWEEAHERMETLCGFLAPLGVCASHVDLASGDLRGNIPFAPAHLALVEAALVLATGPR